LIRYIQHKDIDKQRWDAALEASVNALPYAYSWYLDAVSGQSWDALILDDYAAIFPLPVKRKFFVSMVYQPFFTQQLGLFVRDAATLTLLPDFLKAIPRKFLRVYLHLNAANVLPEAARRLTHQVALNTDYSYIYNHYSSVVVKNLKRIANQGMVAESSADVYTFIRFMQDQLGSKLSDLAPGDMRKLETLLLEVLERKKGFIRYALDKDGNRIAGTCIVRSNNRCIYLLAASTNAGKKKSGMTFLIDSVFQELAGKDIVFDFEGSMIPGIARFYKNFGGQEVYFPCFSRKLL
jgi:Mor family transcriptional regulator